MKQWIGASAIIAAAWLSAGCDDDEAATPGSSGTSGTAGSSGSAGESGSAGTSGNGGASGTAGAGGSAGANGGSGTAGGSGNAGASGAGGGSGADGGAGASGSDGGAGASGASGTGGSAGASGAAGDGGAGGPGTDSRIFGAYEDNFGGPHWVSAAAWRSGSASFRITRIDEPGQSLVAQNAATNTYSPNLWSRFDWTESAGALWYCQSAYDAASEALALAAPAPDRSSPSTGGCGGSFAWSKLIPIAIAGAYLDDFAGTHAIDRIRWVQGDSTFTFAHVKNAMRLAIAQNAPSNTYFPGQWSRFDWTESAGSLWYCQTAYSAASEAAALATPAADPTAPSTSGCGGFAWSRLTPR